MRQLQLTLESPAANVALDEALLAAAEAGELAGGALRIWESPEYAVVLGRSSEVGREVRLEACRRHGVPIVRRASGGATVLLGPGCLMYAVVLQTRAYGGKLSVDRAHQAALGRLADALNAVGAKVVRAGTSDLAIAAAARPLKKVSGNSLRIKKTHLLYHGTLLYDFDLQRIAQWLGLPVRQPDYRADRPHREFVANLPLPRQHLVDALIAAWQAEEPLTDWPRIRTAQIANDVQRR